MTSFESEAARVIVKLNGEKFNFWKLKIKLLLASMNLWDIVHGSEEILSSNADPKVLKEDQRRIKEAMSIIGLSLANNQLTYIKSYKRPVETCKNL